MTKNTTQAQEEIKSLKEDIVEIKDLLTEHAKETAGKSSKFFSKEDLQDIAKQTGQQIYSIFNNKQKQFEEVKDKYEEKVKKSPFAALGIAFVCGALLTAIFKRNSQ